MPIHYLSQGYKPRVFVIMVGLVFFLVSLGNSQPKETPSPGIVPLPVGVEPSYATIIIDAHMGLRPKNLVAAPGTVVIWVNFFRSPIEIVFTGQKVTLACQSPVHFVVGEGGAYISDKIPNGATASLCFIEKGNFKYKASRAYLPYSERVPEIEGEVIIK
jgi:hypothetical protein